MFDDLFEGNDRYVTSFSLAGLSPQAARQFAVVTCMDTRIEPLAMLGLVPGDAKILRNAGGRVTPDVLRSLILATRFLGVRRIAVMQHTGCALAYRTQEDLGADLAAAEAPGWEAWDYLAMADPDADLAADVATVRGCATLPDGVVVEGWRYDVDTGRVHRIIPS